VWLMNFNELASNDFSKITKALIHQLFRVEGKNNACKGVPVVFSITSFSANHGCFVGVAAPVRHLEGEKNGQNGENKII
jgi:hypothetical protein